MRCQNNKFKNVQKHANSASGCAHRFKHKWPPSSQSLIEANLARRRRNRRRHRRRIANMQHIRLYHYPWTDSLLFGGNLRDMTNAFIISKIKTERTTGQKTASRSLLAKVWEQMLLECFFSYLILHLLCFHKLHFAMRISHVFATSAVYSFFVQIGWWKNETIRISRDWK